MHRSSKSTANSWGFMLGLRRGGGDWWKLKICKEKKNARRQNCVKCSAVRTNTLQNLPRPTFSCAALPKACITSKASVMGRREREGRAARERGSFALCKLSRVAFGRGPSSRGLYIGVDDAGSGFGGRRAAAPPCHLETLRNFGDDMFGVFLFVCLFVFLPASFSRQNLVQLHHDVWGMWKKTAFD